MAGDSSQTKLIRVRPPRVEITYDAEVAGAIERRQIPFIIGVLADLSGTPRQEKPPLRYRQFLDVDFDTLDRLMTEIGPQLMLELDREPISLSFRSLTDFEPEGLTAQIPALGSQPRKLDRILHSAPFQQLERAWRSLHYLLSQSETGVDLRIRVLDVSKRELLRDFKKSTGFEESGFFRKAYEEPFGSRHPEPFGAFIGDFEFTAEPADIDLLRELSKVSAACAAPFIAGLSPRFFSFDTFGELGRLRQAPPLETPAYAQWNSFRSSEDSRYVGLTIPRMLLRAPYGGSPVPDEVFQHHEIIESDGDLLWGSAAFAFAARIANSFAKYFWSASIRGPESGGLVEGLPARVEITEDQVRLKSPLDYAMTDRREKEFSDAGFIPLLAMKNTDSAVFFSVPSCHRPQTYESDTVNAYTRLSCQLPYVLAAGRFLHYIKIMGSSKMGSFVSLNQVERHLNEWISNYILLDENASLAAKAKRPLREARIEVAEDPAKPGAYRAVAFLRPHFQLAELPVSLRLTTEIPTTR